MKITGEQLKKIVRNNRDRSFNLDSRVSTEALIWFTYDVLREIGEKDVSEKIMDLIEAIDGLETGELAELHIW